MFFCNIIKEQIDESNIKLWNRKINFIIKNSGILPIYIKVLKRYEIDNFDDYINYIINNINNPTNLDKLNKLYKKNLLIEMENEEKIERTRRGLLLFNSIRYNSSNVRISLLINKDAPNIYPIYYEFKINYMKEDITIEESNDYVDDFLLKENIYGIFDHGLLVGIMICNNKKFYIDNNSNKVNTFYIQEIIVNKNYHGKKYGYMLIKYAILLCPSDIEFISFMTTENNGAMHTIASKLDFIKQKISSGDNLNPSLFIRVNNKIDREIYNDLNYLRTITSIYI